MNAASPLGESEFHQRVEEVMASIETQLEERDDIDCEINGGILTLEFDDGSKVIINRQTPSREIWVAAKSGGFHFRFGGTDWLDTRSGEALPALLSRVVGEQSGAGIAITI
jgi:CyaY protein